MTEIRRTDEAPARTRRPWLRPAFAAAAVATAAAVTVVVLPASGSGGAQDRPSAEAVTLLEDIALAAEAADAPVGIRDDQFVYIKSRDAYAVYTGDGPGKLEPVHDREVWLSVDGTREGLLKEDSNGLEHEPLAPAVPDSERSTHYRALAELPTDPDRMRDWLYEVSAEQVDEERPDRDDAAFVLFGDLIGESMMPPQVSAALYRAAAQIPGVTVVRHVKDSVGRDGVAVTRDSAGDDAREELIFDEQSHVFLGERTYDGDGRLTGTSAVIERAVVDKAGRRP